MASLAGGSPVSSGAVLSSIASAVLSDVSDVADVSDALSGCGDALSGDGVAASGDTLPVELLPQAINRPQSRTTVDSLSTMPPSQN